MNFKDMNGKLNAMGLVLMNKGIVQTTDNGMMVARLKKVGFNKKALFSNLRKQDQYKLMDILEAYDRKGGGCYE